MTNEEIREETLELMLFRATSVAEVFRVLRMMSSANLRGRARDLLTQIDAAPPERRAVITPQMYKFLKDVASRLAQKEFRQLKLRVERRSIV